MLNIENLNINNLILKKRELQMRLREDYKKKLTTKEDAVSIIESGNRIYVSGNAATPFPIVEALAERKDSLQDVDVVHVLLLGNDPLSAPGMEGHFRHKSLFVGPADRKAVNEGKADYFPIFLYEIPQLFVHGKGTLPLYVAIIQTSPPDTHGFLSYGVEDLATKAAAESAKKLIVQVNDKMPRTLGDCFIHISKATKIIETSEELPTLEITQPSEVEMRIGEYIADLVEDGSTLQLGIGASPNAGCQYLANHRDLGIHTELFCPGMVDLIRKGVITGRRKNLNPRKHVFTNALGDKDMYAFMHDNPSMASYPVSYTNDPRVIAQNDNMISINSTIEVDLLGQCNSEFLRGHEFSGTGGQLDYVRGAFHSQGGKSIIACYATTHQGEVSRVVPSFAPGTVVTTPRMDTHFLATEYGVVNLKGKSTKERALDIINIAHPKFRDDLLKEAQNMNIL